MSTAKTVVVEENNVISGLYSALSEIFAVERVCRSILKIGLEDVFTKEYGRFVDVGKQTGWTAGRYIKKWTTYK